ncbi:sensor histidine kinase [Georgenia sp. Z1344]|uniref:sensor histidine kinase n=1 Tax=Georgenia sp. Z1344 TaxID=3416706 RepID=UPI003CF9D08E
MSSRWKLTLSYAGFLMVAGVLLLAVVWVFLLRYVPDSTIDTRGGFVPNRSDLLEAFVPPTVVVLVLLLTLGPAGGWLLAGRMLSPLERITRATRIASTGALDHRVDMSDRTDEFGELADSFDHMLERVEARVEEQRRFAANASHELRTPLAVMQTIIDVAAKAPDKNPAATLARLRATNARAVELVEALLLLDRSGHPLTRHEEVDLSLLLDEAVESLLPLAEQHGVTIEIDASPSLAEGSEPLLRQMMTNLLHNAVVHNVADGGRVWATTVGAADRATVTIANTGGAVGPGTVHRLTEPFLKGAGRTRLDERTGNGLGLSIVERIVDAHAGTLVLAPRADGGLEVRTELPPARGRDVVLM